VGGTNLGRCAGSLADPDGNGLIIQQDDPRFRES
jgi:hypothetical protein